MLGIVSSIIMASQIIMVEKEYGGMFGGTYSEFSSTGLIITISTFFSSILFSMLLKIAAETSANIREIRDIVKNK